ncbi:MAG: hypothetical protein ACK5A0_14465 [Polaromonas sp.]|jgi:glycerol kinase
MRYILALDQGTTSTRNQHPATVQWLRDGLQIIGSAAKVQALAETVPDSGDVYLVPAFTGLGTAYPAAPPGLCDQYFRLSE